MFTDVFGVADLPCEHLREIYQYWLQKKGARHMPSRADINPRDIVEYLPFISMVDVERDPLRFRFRLVGTETVRAMGIDVTGKYSDMNPAIAVLNERYTWIVENKRPYLYNGELTWSENSFLNYYALAMPLSNDDTEVNIILYGMYFTFPDSGERTADIIINPGK